VQAVEKKALVGMMAAFEQRLNAENAAAEFQNVTDSLRWFPYYSLETGANRFPE
jgi:hypothetical protein